MWAKMVIQLQPDQIVAFWDAIKHGMSTLERIRERGGSPQDRLNSVLKNLLSGYLQCWIIFEEEEGKRKLHAFGISYIMKDRLTDKETLIIDSLYGFRKLSNELAVEAIDKLKEYAKNTGCSTIYAITSNKRVIDLMELNNFKPIYQIYSLEV